MNQNIITYEKYMDKTKALKAFIYLIQNAHAGEKAAANAYWGHYHSIFIKDPQEKQQVFQIYKDELDHRKKLYQMLNSLGAKPRPMREIQMFVIGFVIGFLSLWGTWFIPMYGAGRLESSNIGEYEIAARLAFFAGRFDLIDELLNFAEVEHDHELFFRNKAESHFVSKFFPIWDKPSDKIWIRQSMNEFVIENNKILNNREIV